MIFIVEKMNVIIFVYNVINNKEEIMLFFDSNILSFKDFYQVIVYFCKYYVDKVNCFMYDMCYGMKYFGKLKYIYYVFYVILWGKFVEIIMYDENSELYIDVCESFLFIWDGRMFCGCVLFVEVFGLSVEQICYVFVIRKNEK